MIVPILAGLAGLSLLSNPPKRRKARRKNPWMNAHSGTVSGTSIWRTNAPDTYVVQHQDGSYGAYSGYVTRGMVAVEEQLEAADTKAALAAKCRAWSAKFKIGREIRSVESLNNPKGGKRTQVWMNDRFGNWQYAGPTAPNTGSMLGTAFVPKDDGRIRTREEAAEWLQSVKGLSAAFVSRRPKEWGRNPQPKKRTTADTYKRALEIANAMMDHAEELEPTSALKEGARSVGIPYGAEMEKFVAWARKRKNPPSKSYILEIGPSKYVGGAMTASGYGSTTIKAFAISFGSVAEAEEWMSKYGVDAAIIDAQSGVMKNPGGGRTNTRYHSVIRGRVPTRSSSRTAMTAWLQRCDPAGAWTDARSRDFGYPAQTKAEAWAAVKRMIRDLKATA